MSVKTVYVAENEVCYEMPLKVLNELIYKGILQVVKTEVIEQMWLGEIQVPNTKVTMKSRIRKIITALGDPVHTYDTKYYLTKEKRIELSAPMSVEEYLLIGRLHKGLEVVNKTRLLLNDSHTLYTYEVDIYKDRPTVRVEVEFDSEQDMNKFEAPEWLAQWRKA